jgi:hypothetical protein
MCECQRPEEAMMNDPVMLIAIVPTAVRTTPWCVNR